MKEKEIKEWLEEVKDNLDLLEEEGDGRDWQAYDEMTLEVEILEAILK